MHGAVIPVTPQRHWDFSYLASSGTEEIFVARALNVTPFKSLALFVRVHSNSMPATGNQKIEIEVRNIYPEGSDPTVFQPTGTLMTATIDNSTAIGRVVEVEAPAGVLIGPWVSVKVRGNQDSTSTTPKQVEASLSIGLLGRVN